MPNALLAEFCRAATLSPTFIRRCQREFHKQLQPVWDEAQALREENADLTRQLEEIKANPPKRPRGRPRKIRETEALV